MANDDDMINFEMMNSVVENRLGVIVAEVELAGEGYISLGNAKADALSLCDVSVYEDFSRHGGCNH